MSITLYTAPDCIRCKIVKNFLAERGLDYDTIDFKADAQAFNTFYRTNRKSIYRNPEGVEFPLFDDGKVIKQGSGEILAYLLSGQVLESCVTRSDMLHGKISGIYPSQCPDGQEENMLTLVDRLAKGGLQVWLQVDGRKPALLQNFLCNKDVRVILNVVGGNASTERTLGGAPTKSELAETIDLVRNTPEGIIRFFAVPQSREDGTWSWPDRSEAVAAAQMVAEACNLPTLPYSIDAVTPEMAWDMRGLEALPEQTLLIYRSASRQFLFKADIAK